MPEDERFKDLDPSKIIQEMRDEYWREISEVEEDVVDDAVQILTVEVAKELFSLPAGNCKTIIKAGHITRVPRMPEYIMGVVNLRGQILPVVDLGRLLGLGKHQAGPKARLVVVESDDVRASFQVERVIGIEWVEQSRISEPESVKSGAKVEYVKGHIQPAEEEGAWVTLLDADKIIHGPDLAVGTR